MSYWVAASFGALDVRNHDLASEGYEFVVTPIIPSPPQILWGDGAALWSEALDAAIDDSDVDEPTRDALAALEDLGVLVRSESPTLPSRRASPPWLVSYQHELVYALLSNVADQAGIDIVFIKGPVLHWQGLRGKEHSGDVDCWVRPGHETILAEAMERWGWRTSRTAFDGTRIAHSQTLMPGEWGCEIDVHTRFPGMTLDESAAFDLVLANTVTRAFAGTLVRVPSPPVHAVIYALHELRPVAGRQHTPEQRSTAVRALTSAGDSTIDVTERLGAGFVLKDALSEGFPDFDPSRISTRIPSDWEWRSVVSVPRRQLAAVRLLPWRQRARVVKRLVWPARDASRRVRAASDLPPKAVFLVRVKRLRDGLVRLLRGD
ncbi:MULTISPECIES: nucleotidyltransferase family protein [unclassified Microbacterium]|uniref:nucleotidyltransferase family protein n=1 Tax=unclassified Microbacterium TaxID=2609290 RepID=UPI001604DD4E|nr:MULTISPECIES: nucleotidyltransferase family protein [unclassified Microbacterium]QNA91995.1 nucleotidyltransferase family protein [Microbacterium sp. Se63.02b]QYM65225.1 nucleotidyltransferase family protein [Microbacterium sp. Se5.02b]